VSGFLKGALLYFAIVFSAGFVLGTLRVLIVVPRLGTRAAELIELPVMLAVTIISARWIVQRPWVGSPAGRLAMGSAALALLLAAEFSLVLWLRGLTIREYIAAQDPVSGTAYYLALALFGVMPLLVGGSIASTRRNR
jgi:hypothetical protein